MEVRAIDWDEGATFKYNQKKWSPHGSVYVSLHGKFTGKLSVKIRCREDPSIVESGIHLEWRAETKGGVFTFPSKYRIEKPGSGYAQGERVTIGNHSAIVFRTMLNPLGGIAGLKDVKKGKCSDDTEVKGGGGSGASIHFSRDEVDYEDGMRLKLHLRTASDKKKFTAVFLIDGKIVGESLGFIVASKDFKESHKDAVTKKRKRVVHRERVLKKQKRKKDVEKERLKKKVDEKEENKHESDENKHESDENKHESDDTEEEDSSDDDSSDDDDSDDDSDDDESDDNSSDEEGNEESSVLSPPKAKALTPPPDVTEFDKFPFLNEIIDNHVPLIDSEKGDVAFELRSIRFLLQDISATLKQHDYRLRQLAALNHLQQRET